MVLYENGNEVVSLRFNATGTNNLNWFLQENLISSPWSDLKTAANVQHFDLIGSFDRYFELTRSYDGCGGDVGWLVITGPGCPCAEYSIQQAGSCCALE